MVRHESEFISAHGRWARWHCLTFAGGASAQTTSSAVLNSLEVQELIKRAEPADHARLEVHFAVLAEQYAADARRHSAMAQAFIASPIRRTAANSAADHCKRLEQLNLQSAATLRELAAHHEGLAAGKASAEPRGAARFEAGAGAPAPTAEELTALAAKASTARRSPCPPGLLPDTGEAVHRGRQRSRRDGASVPGHANYPGGRALRPLVTLSRDAAKEATAAAAMHKQLAGIAR